jgi:hypothetical protein
MVNKPLIGLTLVLYGVSLPARRTRRDGVKTGFKNMETILPLIIQAISGAAGGGIVGNLVKSAGMALLPKLLAGAVGGIGGNAALGGILANTLGSAGGLDLMGIISQVISGGLGGGVLTALAGVVMGAMKK